MKLYVTESGSGYGCGNWSRRSSQTVWTENIEYDTREKRESNVFQRTRRKSNKR